MAGLNETTPGRLVAATLDRLGLEPRQVATFLIVGIIGTIVHYSVALTATVSVHVLVANCMGYLAALGVSYVGHQRFTFQVPREEARHGHRVPRYVATSLIALAASETVLLVAHELLVLPSWLSLMCAVAAVPCITFFAYKYWVFAAVPGKRQADTRGL